MSTRKVQLLGALLVVSSACGSGENRGVTDGGSAAGAAGSAGGSSGGTGGQPMGGMAGEATGGTAGVAGTGQGGESGGAAGACQGCDGFIANTNVGFEDGTFLDQWSLSTNNGADCMAEIVSSPTRNGSYALHISHAIQGLGSFNRCELVSKEYFDLSAAGPGRFNWNTEYWLGYSIYLEDWAADPSTWNVLGQTHAVPFNRDWNCCSGPQFWQVNTSFDEFMVQYSIIDDPYITPVCSGGYTHWGVPLRDMENKWIDIVLHFNASVGSSGFLQAWIDGQQVIDQQGSVLYAYDSCGRPRVEELVFQMGSYKTGNSTNPRSVYYDEIRIAGAEGSYDAVAPR